VLSGTSQAAAFVAGLAGLVWSTPFGTSNAAVRARIEATCDRIPGTGSLWASGRINAARAVGAIP
jgi:thermitase